LLFILKQGFFKKIDPGPEPPGGVSADCAGDTPSDRCHSISDVAGKGPMDRLPNRIRESFKEQWAAYVDACRDLGLSVPRRFQAVSAADSVFPFSEFVFRACLRDPAMLIRLVEGGDLLCAYGPRDYRDRLAPRIEGAETDDDLGQRLRRFRRREMVRIAWRDLAGMADLDEVTTDLSALAGACLDAALSWLYAQACRELGVPRAENGSRQHLVIIGMGKLGAGELNFSSDIDLIFAYPEAGHTEGVAPPMGSDAFFEKLCRRLIGVIGANTQDGIVFRVDLRLRPYGENGPLVMSFDRLETYYEIQGRDWERYAWIKARPVAGDIEAGDRLLARLKPFVFRRYLDYSAFESLRQMKRGIALEVQRKGLVDNIKLGPGGIREIEFFGQMFQLIRGGVLPELQARRIEAVLGVLAREGLVAPDTRETLIGAYRFLRRTEHRLQAYSDGQTHSLPRDAAGRERLAVSMGTDGWEAFRQRLTTHMKAVRRYFDDLLEAGTIDGSEGFREKIDIRLQAVWLRQADAAGTLRSLSEAGYKNPEEALGLVDHFRSDSQTRALSPAGREHLDRLMPAVLAGVGKCHPPEPVLNRILDLLRAIERRTTYLALLYENPAALTHLIRLAAASPWIAAFLAQHPVLLDELLDPRTLYAPPLRAELQKELRQRLDRRKGADLEEQMEDLCLFKQINVLRVAAADITEVLPLMRVSDHLSDIAETVLGEVIELAWRHLTEKHGRPRCDLDGIPCDRGFAVIAYGKLGGIELGYGSDLDLVFLHAGTGEATVGGSRPLDDTTFFARLGQRVLHILTAHTSLGFLYEVDMRLRPSGTSGLLVSRIDGFREYQLNDAWTWEHQALVRARPVGGNRLLADRFRQIRQEVLSRFRHRERLRQEVADMRERLRKERDSGKNDHFDLKQGKGGLIDIEFLVQYLVLRHARQHPSLMRWPDNVRLIRSLAAVGIIEYDTASALRRAYLTYRSKTHRLDLQKKPARVPADQYRRLREEVIEIWRDHLGRPVGET
jgi:[glutamine synthetase] adenylyltransferase / [glutamine synthetase]-adenylyl-L-tyrosine phosphorylase